MNENKPNKTRKFGLKWVFIIFISAVVLVVSALIINRIIRENLVNYQGIDFLEKIVKETSKNTSDNLYISRWVENYYADTWTIRINGSEAQLKVLLNNEFFKGTKYTFTTIVSGITAREMPNAVKEWAVGTSFIDAVNKCLAYKDGSGLLQKGIYSATRQAGPSVFNQYIMPAIWVLFFGIIIITTIASFFGGFGRGIAGSYNSKSVAQRVFTNKKFSDIAGNEEVKEEVMELVDYLKNPKKYSAAGARIPKGILLGGPPGTGKTLIAKATAGEANVPFFFISASNFVEMFVGLGAKRVRDMFEDARKNAPAIIFIDELDAVGRSRGAGIGGGNDEREQTLNQLLVEMDGIQENSGILIMAATNRTDVLDPALLRPGRFDRTITVALPDIKEREAILKLHARGKRIDNSVNFAHVARRTPGFSGAQLENVINEAALLSVREKNEIISIAHIDEAIDRVMAGPAKKSRTISQKENIAVAYHEAGHAVVGLKIKGGNKVQKITIIPRGKAGGYNLMMPEEEKYNHSKTELIAIITSFMGGRVAEAIIYGKDNVSTGASDDIAKATSIARKMVTEWGLSDLGPIKYEEDSSNPFLGRDYMKNASFSNKVGQEIDDEIRKIILTAEKNAHKIISENRELLELIKDALIINETIVAEEIEYIEKNMKLPPAINKTKESLHSEYSQSDFDTLFNEVSGKKNIEEDKYKTDLDNELEKHNINKKEDKNSPKEEN
ncbi:ATP-dependent zinc metalloprotease FtsH [Metamycoplasma equirhinis]|uniref:ATP-dependent zinc metalloprotease FtsH n=3 Tax=Metamycoplasma equirhinis TaxID=92402 RepID=A0ABZ0PAS7_9BACT|nr:ATP-dependent zinc metalloprotease FtsH [Metamycoplasma equirhinis]TPD98839.1 ATP-dependent zinc metalloprotease FtsH [Metamycoplasma equirhinis]WPB54005.1 ATP-dependent zinc metalloprotease FtsH [Metamycoplasma equirhinis]